MGWCAPTAVVRRRNGERVNPTQSAVGQTGRHWPRAEGQFTGNKKRKRTFMGE